MVFLGLQSDEWRVKLDRELRRIGYRLDIGSEYSESGEVATLTPLGRGPSYLLKVTHLQEIGWFGDLLPMSEGLDKDSINDASAIAEWSFDTSRKYEQSCYDVWIDWIVQSVRDAGS